MSAAPEGSTRATSAKGCERPLNLIAELTYRCPLRCPYCSNPVDLQRNPATLDANAWARIFQEASALGIVHVGLTGGEPTTRPDLGQIVRSADRSDLYTHLVTSGLPLRAQGLQGLVEAGLRSVQLSLQDSSAPLSDRIAGTACFDDKIALAREVKRLGLPLVLNVVLHRHNIERTEALIALARDLAADRLELANVQFHGWARRNRNALLPTREQVDRAAQSVALARGQGSRPEILFVLPDHFRDRPKPCMGGWGRKNLVISPDGLVLPCQEAHTLPELEFWKADQRNLRDCWENAPGMNAFRGEDWMQEPCRSCSLRSLDFGGCRCQAFHLVGEARATDPACGLSPEHERVGPGTADAEHAFVYREFEKS